MTTYVAFYFIDSATACTHLFAFDRNSGEWRVPCGLISRPNRNQVTYSPTRPMCRTCVRRTEPKVTPKPARRAAD